MLNYIIENMRVLSGLIEVGWNPHTVEVYYSLFSQKFLSAKELLGETGVKVIFMSDSLTGQTGWAKVFCPTHLIRVGSYRPSCPWMMDVPNDRCNVNVIVPAEPRTQTVVDSPVYIAVGTAITRYDMTVQEQLPIVVHWKLEEERPEYTTIHYISADGYESELSVSYGNADKYWVKTYLKQTGAIQKAYPQELIPGVGVIRDNLYLLSPKGEALRVIKSVEDIPYVVDEPDFNAVKNGKALLTRAEGDHVIAARIWWAEEDGWGAKTETIEANEYYISKGCWIDTWRKLGGEEATETPAAA